MVQAPLVGQGSSFHHEYEDEVNEDKSMWSNNFNYRSCLMSDRDNSNSNYGTESYAPSRNMFQAVDKEGHVPKEMLPGENLEGKTTEVVREMSARRRWVLLCWLLTWWIPSPFLKWFGCMKRQDVHQAWCEKLALNLIIWFICACVVFVITVLGLVTCPTQHVFNTSELTSHSYQNDPNNVYMSIWGEVFDLLGVDLFTYNSGQDLMKKINSGLGLDSDMLQHQKTCLCNLFLVGAVDNINPFVVKEMVHKDFVGPSPYLMYLLLLITCIYILCNYVEGIFGTQP